VVSLASGGTGRTVLLVENDDAVARTIRDALDTSAYRVWLATTGAEAKAVLEKASPDAIVLDLMLPDIDGPRTVLDIASLDGRANRDLRCNFR
jgi:DNA-binding response OmpR family regulator